MLALLHLALLGIALLTIWMWRKLISAARERERQHAVQSSILKAVGDGIVGICPAGRIRYFNSRADSFLGYAIIPGCPLPQSGPHDSELLAQVNSLIEQRGSARWPGTVISRTVQTGIGESIRHYNLSLSTSGVEAGDTGSHVITIRDVTVEVEAARQRADYESRIAEASRVLSYAVITGGIVHEISQPLGAIRNYVHILKNSPETALDSSSQRMIFDHLSEEADRAAEIVRNVRMMGPQETRLDGSCRLSEAVERSVRLVSMGSNPPPSIRIRTAVDEDLHVKGSLPLMGQVIINLLKNALQASSSAGAAGAEIILRKRGSHAEIAVADYGKGVGPEAAEGLFMPFTRSTGGGMGLGLAICQRIANNLGGSVSWENREVGGALFRFNVPLAGEG